MYTDFWESWVCVLVHFIFVSILYKYALHTGWVSVLCIVFTVPAGLMFFLQYLWYWYIMFTIPGGLSFCVYRPCGTDLLCLPFLMGWESDVVCINHYSYSYPVNGIENFKSQDFTIVFIFVYYHCDSIKNGRNYRKWIFQIIF